MARSAPRRRRAGSGAARGVAMARTPVRYWEKWGGEERAAMAAVIGAFNAAQGAYEVVLEDVGDWSASTDLPRFLGAQRRGDPPDLIGLEDAQIVDLAAQGALTPLGAVVDELHAALAGYDGRFLALGRDGGALYGVPSAVNVATLYVNLDRVAGTRFAPGDLPARLAAFDAGLAELRARGDVGFVPTYPGWWPHAWVWFFGGAWFDDAGRFTPRHPANLRAYEWFASFRESGRRAGFDRPINPIEARRPDPFLSGEVAMVFAADWMIPRLARTPDLAWRPAAFPTTAGHPAVVIEADVLSIPAGARCTAGAAAFLRFVTQAEQIERLALGHGKISPLAHWSAQFCVQHRNPQLGLLRAILSSAQLFCDPRVPGWLDHRERIKTACAAIWAGRQSPAQALAAL